MGLAILCTLTLSAAAQTGVRLDLDTVDPRGSSGEQRMELQGNKVRIDHLTQAATASGGVNRAPTSSTIFDGSEMFTVDHRSKTYRAVDPIRSATQQTPSKLTFKKTSGGERIAGFACSNFTKSRDGVEQGTVCIASWKTAPVKKEDLAGLVKYAETIGAAEASLQAILINPEDWPGFPLSSQSNDGQIVRVKSAVRTSIPANEFQPSADYTRKTPP
jgi:hypothetical protein